MSNIDLRFTGRRDNYIQRNRFRGEWIGMDSGEWIQGNGFRGIDLGKKGKGISAVKIIAMGYLASIFVGNIPRSVARAIGRHASSMTR